MKNKIALFFLLLLSVTAFSQANKPSVGDWGIRYGVFFNGGFGQQLTFTRMLKKNLEVGLSTTAAFQLNNQTGGGSTVVSTTIGSLPATQETISQSSTLSVSLNPFLVYHFPIKSNLDLYMGGGVTMGVSSQLKNSFTNRTYATDYEVKSEQSISSVPTIYGGASGIIGCQYFFYKNLALGAQAGFGFTVGGAVGTTRRTTVITNSGALNPSQGTNTAENETTGNYTTASAGIAGNVGLNLTFYFGKVSKQIEAVN